LPRRVLIVEDNPDSLDTLRVLVACWGHEVEVAADGLEGLNKAPSWRPDVVLVDIGLPLLDGYELALRLRAALGDSILLIAHTGYSDEKRSLANGFDLHLTKPAEPDVLCRLLTS
jgi:two-component system, sensor histidine kinase